MRCCAPSLRPAALLVPCTHPFPSPAHRVILLHPVTCSGCTSSQHVTTARAILLYAMQLFFLIWSFCSFLSQLSILQNSAIPFLPSWLFQFCPGSQSGSSSLSSHVGSPWEANPGLPCFFACLPSSFHLPTVQHVPPLPLLLFSRSLFLLPSAPSSAKLQLHS